jgi:ribonuclease J
MEEKRTRTQRSVRRRITRQKNRITASRQTQSKQKVSVVKKSNHTTTTRHTKRVFSDVNTRKKQSGINKSSTHHAHTRKKNTGTRRTKRSPSVKTNTKFERKKEDIIPSVGNNIRVIPLGGVEEVGRNMIAVEYKNDIIVLDVGFQFEEEATPGIDYILPNTKYLEDRKDKIRGVIITHGHLDHIGGLPYIMPKIGNPPIYTRYLTSLMILKRQDEFPDLPELDINIVEPNTQSTLGNLVVEFFPVTHSIPDSMGVSIKTPFGNIVISGDMRLDHIEEKPTEAEKETWGNIGKQNNLLFIADSTNAEFQGFSIPESKIIQNLEKIIQEIPGRIIVGTFASQFARMIKLIQIAEKLGKKVVTDGRSIKTNIEIAEKAGLLKVDKGTIIPIEEMKDYPQHKIFILATGAQGEEFASLMRIASKKHKYIQFTPKDTIILSSSIIPGNEISVQKLKDNLYRHDVRIIHYRVSDVHASGHGRIEELKWINKQVGAKYFMPCYGYHSMLRTHAHEIEATGFQKKNIIVPDNGMLIDMNDKELIIQKEKAPTNIVMVDGFSIGEVQEVVLRDRTMLAQDGMFVVIAIVDMKTGRIRKSPDIISRGFVYLRESQDLLRQARYITKKTIEDIAVGMNPINFDELKREITDNVGRFLVKQTAKRPIILPVLIGV